METWLEHCPRCGIWRSHLKSRFEESQASLSEARDVGFRRLRTNNFRKILSVMETRGKLAGRTLVDIGCAQGWFLEEAQKKGMIASGIEPEPVVAQIGIDRGLAIKVGFFPDAMSGENQVDFLVFNDVFEHLPEPATVLANCYERIKDGGYLVLNVPSSKGLFFRLAHHLACLGAKWSLRRLWQADFYTPHLFYFHPGNLAEFAEKSGFDSVAYSRLDTISTSGLWERLNIPGGEVPLWRRVLLAAALSTGSPLINHILPPDSFVLLLKKRSLS